MKFVKSILAGISVTLGLVSAAVASPIVVGGKNFTEQQIIAEMTAQLLKAKGYEVDKRAGLGTAPLRQGQESGQIDVYWEYTGTSLITFNKITEKMDAETTYNTVKKLDEAKGLVWLNPSKVNSTYTLAMRADEAKAKGLTSISELAAAVNGGDALKFGCNAEFYARPDGLKPFEKAYGFEFGRDNIVRMDFGLVYQALKDKQVDVSIALSTDGRIPAFDLVALKDDKGYFPSYAMTPVIRKAVLDENPKLADLLNAISAKLDDETMTKLNSAVDVDRKSIEEVSSDFIAANKF